MAENPSASVVVDDEAGASAGATGYVTVFACVPTNADITPRVMASAKGVLSQHGYSQGADYVAHHIEATRKPVLFIGLPIDTAGTIGRQNATGVTGTCAITVAASASGVVEEVDGVIEVLTGGTIGTAGIVLSVSMDGGRTEKNLRLGTATSYVVPYVGVTINFGAGTLVVGDVYTFATTAPKYSADDLALARAALASQQKPSRSWMVIGELDDSDAADDVVTQVNAYETSNKRFTYARVSVRDRLPLATAAKAQVRMTGAPNITFAEVGATGDTITRATGSFVSDGFAAGMAIDVAGSASNNFTKAKITAVSATVLTLDTQDLAAEGPVSGVSIVGSHGLTFAEVGGTGDTITRSGGSWIDDGFRVGDTVTITGSSSNNVSGAIAALTATVLTFGTTDLAAEFIGTKDVTVTKGETMAAWVSAMDAEFSSVDSQKRIDISLGRARKASPIHGWKFRRPAQWPVSVREYAHDLQIPTYRKADGPLDGWSLEDEDGNIVEYNEELDGGALAARFTCLKAYPNGPEGAFVALSMTRAEEASLLSRTHNLAVTNLACTTCQAETENAIGQVLVLNKDGTGREDSLAKIEQRVNSSLGIALLTDSGEGPRASSAKWVASRNNILNVPGAELTGVLSLLLNGTLEKISTSVKIQTAG